MVDTRHKAVDTWTLLDSQRNQSIKKLRGSTEWQNRFPQLGLFPVSVHQKFYLSFLLSKFNLVEGYGIIEIGSPKVLYILKVNLNKGEENINHSKLPTTYSSRKKEYIKNKTKGYSEFLDEHLFLDNLNKITAFGLTRFYVPEHMAE